MAIWAIADIHASRRDPATGLLSKPMDVFGERWANHLDRLAAAWQERVSPGDTVIIAGDIDWGLHLEDAEETLCFLDGLNGRKILLRGNHDYWWSSKATNRVRRALPPTLVALHNEALRADGFNVCGAKGSPVPGALDWTAQDEKLLHREVQRLSTSLDQRDPELPTIVALHYPPFYLSAGSSLFRDTLESAQVRCVVYGHLHGTSAAAGPGGCINHIEYRLVAGDALGFAPLLIGAAGQLADYDE